VYPADRATLAAASSAHLRRGDEAGLNGRKARIAGFEGLALAALEQFEGTQRHIDLVAPQDVQCISAGRRVGDRGARRDVDRVVAGHVGQQQVHDAGGRTGGSQPSALDGRQVPAHAVHLSDAGAAGQQRAIERLLVGQRESGQCQWQQRGAATRDQGQDEVIFGQPLDELEQPLGGRFTGRVGDRVGRLDDLDALAGHRVAVPRDDEPSQRAGPVIFHRSRHGRRGLAGADHHQAAFRRSW
jgi:hypothetical protein